MAKKFPKTLFVKIETDGDTSYFISDDAEYGLGVMGEKIKIGVYELVETREAEVVLKTRKLAAGRA